MNVKAAIGETMSLAHKEWDKMPTSRAIHRNLRYEHLCEMYVTILEHPEMSVGKLNRWLAWMQAAIYSWGVAELDVFKKINKKHAIDSDEFKICQCALSGELHVVDSKTCCEACENHADEKPMTVKNVNDALDYERKHGSRAEMLILRQKLKLIAEFPITDPKNLDSLNMQLIAKTGIDSDSPNVMCGLSGKPDGRYGCLRCDRSWDKLPITMPSTCVNAAKPMPPTKTKHAIHFSNVNVGHGWVNIRPDGAVARCGGPGLCSACKSDLTELENRVKNQCG